ncbi:Centaurin-gamma-1A-like Protein [Tribolium castaneum]|uniref:Centaurin-gamma-1A-like Protein n=1 Tax=Tribolium castaneum TaxID=7070 RepID=D6X4L2_TRICA|nr:Centaurin-gamma-1A-like Protein [Tribolium castaneum]
MVDLKGETVPITPKKSRGISMTTVKNWLMPERKTQDTPKFQRMPESFLRSIRRRSLRVKRTKSLVLPEKRKSDSFVNSQEWTLSRTVPDLRLGIVGSLSSGKSALVHRYLTGSYMQEESPEGGRFKKEILVDNQSYLLLIRDEGGPPELQFTAWVDAVIFVFSLENESSFNAIYNYYTKMSHYRNSAEIPLILVGTQDAISENNPRVIDDSRARKLANDLKRCSYYETCATYGLNVERVFQDDPDGYEFFIVSLDNKQWHFEASSSDERDDWVAAIEQQILNSLQLNESSKGKKQNNPMEAATIQSIRSRVPGNGFCVDCDATNPDWASLNLGVLMCIECSGIHRNLGSHISRVRSLDLDEWPAGHLSVMLAIGNTLANSVWECRTQGRTKPTPTSSREEKERWIRAKYESKEFLPPPNTTMPLGQQLVDAVCSSNMKAIIHVLAMANTEQVNTTVAPRDLRTPLHLACAMGNLAVAQLLIWHNANVKAVDQDGRTCLAYARAAASIAAAKSQSNNSVSADVSAAASRSLVDLLLSYGCPEVSCVPGSGTLPRRRGTTNQTMPQLPSSVI